jgi:hypothetical protein
VAVALASTPGTKPRVADVVEDGGKKCKAKSKASQGVEKLKKLMSLGWQSSQPFSKRNKAGATTHIFSSFICMGMYNHIVCLIKSVYQI